MIAYAKERTTSRSLFETYHNKMETARSNDEKKCKKITASLDSNIGSYCWECFTYYHKYLGLFPLIGITLINDQRGLHNK